MWPSKLRVADFISHRGSTWASRVSAVEFSSLSVSVSVAAVSLSSVSLDSYNRIGTASTARPIAKAAPGIFLFLFRRIFKRKWNRDAPSPYQGYLPKVPMPRGNEGTKQKQYGKVDANQIRCNARSLRQYQGPSHTLPFFPFIFYFFLIVSFSISQIYSVLFASSRPPYLVGTESVGKAKPSNASRATHSLNEEGQVRRVLRTSLIVSHTRAMPQGAAVGRARLGRKGIGG